MINKTPEETYPVELRQGVKVNGPRPNRECPGTPKIRKDLWVAVGDLGFLLYTSNFPDHGSLERASVNHAMGDLGNYGDNWSMSGWLRDLAAQESHRSREGW
jgi:hypothetical protein